MVRRRMAGAGTRDRGRRFEIRRHTGIRGSEGLAAEGEADQDPVTLRAARLGAERLPEMIDPESATSEASWWIAAPASCAYQAHQKAPAVEAGIDRTADIGAVVRVDVVPQSLGLRRNRSWPRWRVAASAARWLAQRPLPS
jgi:hypothetical protein